MSLTSLADGWGSLAWAVTWQLAALALLGWLAERLLRLRQPRARHALWWFVLVAPLLLAPGRLVLERWQAVVTVTVPPAISAAAEIPRYASAPLLPLSDAPTVPAPAGPPVSARGLTVRVVDALALAWLVGCALLALRLVMGHRRLRRMLADSRPVEDADAADVLRALCAEAGVRAEVSLRSSDSVGAPVLYGLRRPVIVVPQDWVDSLAPDELRALLAHEVAHLRRRDVLANLAQRLIEIPLFFHPGAWLASRRITLAREELCDTWVVQRGADPAGYARWLTAAAERAYANGAAASLGVAESRFTLLRRVEAIMSAGTVKRLSRPLAICLAVLALATAAAFAAVQFTGHRAGKASAGSARIHRSAPGAASPSAGRIVLRGTSELTPDETKVALSELGLRTAQFAYNVPFAHDVRLVIECYERGKRKPPLMNSTLAGLAPGRHAHLVLMHESDEVLSFSWAHSGDGWSTSGKTSTNAAVSLKGYQHKTHSGPASETMLEPGKRTLILGFIADRGPQTPYKTPDFDADPANLISEHDLVVLVFMTLEQSASGSEAVKGAERDANSESSPAPAAEASSGAVEGAPTEEPAETSPVLGLHGPLHMLPLAQPGEPLRIRIPRDIDPGKVTMLSGVYGYGLGLLKITTKQGVYEYSVNVRKDATSVKLLIYCPGYRVITAEMDAKQITTSKPFVPRFRRLAMVPLRVRLMDTQARPLAGEKVVVRHSLWEMEYFGYGDGMAWPVTIATATTDASGEIALQVPSLLDDPYFAKPPPNVPTVWRGFALALPEHSGGDYGWDFEPSFIPPLRFYVRPVTMRVVYRGKISGRIQQSFLTRHDVRVKPSDARRGPDGEYYPLWFHATLKATGSGSGRAVRPDGTFSIMLPARTYDLSLEVRSDTGHFLRSIPVQTGLILGEKENRVLTLE